MSAPGPSETAWELAGRHGCNARGSRLRPRRTIRTRRVGRHHSQETRETHALPPLSGPLTPTLTSRQSGCPTAEGTVPTGGPSSALSRCINRSPHDHSPIKTDHPFNPPQTLLHTQQPALLILYGRANLELDPLSGEGSDDPGAQPNCVCLTKFDRLIKTLSLRIQRRFVANPRLDTTRSGVQGCLGTRKGVCSSCQRPVRSDLR